MARTGLQEIVNYCDRRLDVAGFSDWSGAWNGLQVENAGDVHKIAATVDAGLATVRLAIHAGADLLLAHHGLFWTARQPWTGATRELMRLVIENNMAVYSSHLPLDAHPTWGNNKLLGQALGLKKPEPFFECKGRLIGLKYRQSIQRSVLRERLAKVLGCVPVLLPGGKEQCRCLGIVTGGAGSEIQQAANEGVDTLITGEGPHWAFGLAEELGLNAFFGGHYATETFGVKALAAHLSRKFRLPWVFIDHPSGL